jgi:hypothetical protein
VPPVESIPQSVGSIRGGSQLIPYEGGYIAVVHEVYSVAREALGANSLLGFFPQPARGPIAYKSNIVYMHRFVRFDDKLTTATLGAPFYFEDYQIEFCAGLAHFAGKYVLSYGVNDKFARIALVDPEVVRDLLPKDT